MVQFKRNSFVRTSQGKVGIIVSEETVSLLQYDHWREKYVDEPLLFCSNKQADAFINENGGTYQKEKVSVMVKLGKQTVAIKPEKLIPLERVLIMAQGATFDIKSEEAFSFINILKNNNIDFLFV